MSRIGIVTSSAIMVLTASALFILATASPVAAQIVRWRTVIAIVQPGNIVGSFTTPPSCPINGAGCFNGGGLAWSGGDCLRTSSSKATIVKANPRPKSR